MTMTLDEDRRSHVVERLRGFYLEELDEELSAFRAERIVDFLLETLGPPVYNQAVQDARGYMQRKLEDLEGEVYAPELRP